MTSPTLTNLKVFRDEAGGAADQGGGNPPAGGGNEGPWYAVLPESYHKDPNITKYGSLEEYVVGQMNKDKLIGKPADRLIEIPDGDDAEARLAVLRRLGAPETVDGYKLSPVEGLDDTLGPEGGLAKMFVTAAHKHGLLPAQVQGIYEEVARGLHQAIQDDEGSAAAAAKAASDALKQKWGPAYDQKKASAKFAVEKLAERAKVDLQAVGDIEVDPAMLELFAVVGDMLSEDSAGGGGVGGIDKILPPAEAQAKGQEYLEKAMAASDPGERKRLNDLATKYFQMAFPEDPS